MKTIDHKTFFPFYLDIFDFAFGDEPEFYKMHQIKIEKLTKQNLDSFLVYLKNHLSENGDHHFFFLPLNKEQSQFSSEWESKFRNGWNKKIGEPGWRNIWLAINHDHTIVGHIDIRPHQQLNTEHRVVLGMGTDSQFRKLKIGKKLLQFVIGYCRNQPQISWLDLDVLSINTPAIRLYENSGFQLLQHVKDMFRINNESYDYQSMTLNVETIINNT